MCGIRCSRIKLRTSSCHNDCGVNQCKECNALAVISLIIYLITYPFEPQHLIKSLSLVVKNAQLTSDAKKKNNFPALFAWIIGHCVVRSLFQSFAKFKIQICTLTRTTGRNNGLDRDRDVSQWTGHLVCLFLLLPASIFNRRFVVFLSLISLRRNRARAPTNQDTEPRPRCRLTVAVKGPGLGRGSRNPKELRPTRSVGQNNYPLKCRTGW